jgi:hypothetical protein
MQKPDLRNIESHLNRAERDRALLTAVPSSDLRALLQWAAHLELAVMASAPPPRSQPSSGNAMGFE